MFCLDGSTSGYRLETLDRYETLGARPHLARCCDPQGHRRIADRQGNARLYKRMGNGPFGTVLRIAHTGANFYGALDLIERYRRGMAHGAKVRMAGPGEFSRATNAPAKPP